MYDTLYAILNKSKNATLQYFIFCEKVLDEKYLLKLNQVFQTKWFVETLPICLFWCLSYVLFFLFKALFTEFCNCACAKKDCYAYLFDVHVSQFSITFFLLPNRVNLSAHRSYHYSTSNVLRLRCNNTMIFLLWKFQAWSIWWKSAF